MYVELEEDPNFEQPEEVCNHEIANASLDDNGGPDFEYPYLPDSDYESDFEDEVMDKCMAEITAEIINPDKNDADEPSGDASRDEPLGDASKETPSHALTKANLRSFNEHFSQNSNVRDSDDESEWTFETQLVKCNDPRTLTVKFSALKALFEENLGRNNRIPFTREDVTKQFKLAKPHGIIPIGLFLQIGVCLSFDLGEIVGSNAQSMNLASDEAMRALRDSRRHRKPEKSTKGK